MASKNQSFAEEMSAAWQEVQEKAWQEKRKKERIGNEWTPEESMAHCGCKIGEHLRDDGWHATIHYCRQPECDDCTKYKAEQDRYKIERAANEFVNDNPKAKLYHLKNLPKEKEQAKLKYIKRHSGIYRRKDNGDGTIDIFAATEHDKPTAYGDEIEPKLFYDEDNQPYESYNLSDMSEYFETATATNRTNKTRWTGKLSLDKSEENRPDRIRYIVISPHSKEDWQLKHEIDKELETSGEIAPTEEVADFAECQAELDKWGSRYVEKYNDRKMKYDIKAIFRHVNGEKFRENWNIRANANKFWRDIEKCPSKVLDISQETIPTSYLDKQAVMEFA